MKENQIPYYEHTSEIKKLASRAEKEKSQLQAIIDTYHSMKIDKLQSEDLHFLLKDAGDFVKNRIVKGKKTNLNGLELSETAITEMVKLPDNLPNLLEQIRIFKLSCQGFNLKFYEIQSEKIEMTENYLNTIESLKNYAQNKDEAIKVKLAKELIEVAEKASKAFGEKKSWIQSAPFLLRVGDDFYPDPNKVKR